MSAPEHIHVRFTHSRGVRHHWRWDEDGNEHVAVEIIDDTAEDATQAKQHDNPFVILRPEGAGE